MLTRDEIQEMRRTSAENHTMRAEQWRIAPGAGRRTVFAKNVPLLLRPGGEANLTDPTTGVAGARETFVAFVDRARDVREHDQFRNVREADGSMYEPSYKADGTPDPDGTQFTVSAVSRHPTVTMCRLFKES